MGEGKDVTVQVYNRGSESITGQELSDFCLQNNWNVNFPQGNDLSIYSIYSIHATAHISKDLQSILQG